ncbi:MULTISPECIES: metal ABC transporter permease [Halomonas]|uniref:Metal ABC transporter permease n=1 Tax=Halomonas litopenaei TaxID=2109328 RepID=A0ABX5IZN9_9GAMM|nr:MULTISPECIES: metal ABC transporter permease [Halomonas]MBR9772337.1 metal ABC transporter permease [Gammaproteobacteria bacterium]KJZ12609.1 zinc ABC transporter permease [Halomonas sp. S2151]MBR9880108.1 metal ABC transporter permease [Gammaproteobacteria bacterium]MCJ8284671.1 metal ABC transporter permease [Halomonas sp.]MCO7214483.1 metal ABC transporter permease [Halomonas sp. OfavH-34-E]
MMASLFNNIPLMIMLVGALVGIASSLVGTFLVLRGTSMLSDAIGHSIVFGIVVVWLLTHQASGPLQIIGAALTGIFTVFLTELLVSTQKVKKDAAIGLVFPVLFSLGVLLINLYASDVHIDAHTVLLGEIGFVWLDTLPIGGVEVPRALVSMGAMTALNLAFVAAFYKELKLATFDSALAKALGFAPTALFYALLLLTSGTAVAAFDAVGAVLFVAFVIVPPSAAYLLTDRLWKIFVYASLIAAASSVSGYYLAVAWDVSIGGMMAVMTGVFLALAFLLGPRYGVFAQWLERRRQRELNESRTLMVHLYHHEDGPEKAVENVTMALRDHLMWDPARAERVVERSRQRHLVVQEGERLHLTQAGRNLAREILEPGAKAETGA